MIDPTPKDFPDLSTARLALRAPSVNDVGDYRELLSIPAVTRFSDLPDSPSVARTEALIKWMANLQPGGKGCAWLITVAVSTKPIGAIRFNRIDKISKCGVVGYELHPDFWGKGLMTEALSSVVQYGHDGLQLNRIEATTSTGNEASNSVLRKCGFAQEGVLRQKHWFKGAFHDCNMFARLARDPAT